SRTFGKSDTRNDVDVDHAVTGPQTLPNSLHGAIRTSMVTLLLGLVQLGPHNKRSPLRLVMSLLCLLIVVWVLTMPTWAHYEQSLSYLPYNKSITCNVGTEWQCLCSTVDGGGGIVCADLFANIQAVSVHFDGCSFDLAKQVHRGQPYENYIKEYMAWWIREECSMGSCTDVDQRDLVDLNAQNIVLISLECVEAKRTRLSFVALHSINRSAEGNSSFGEDHAWQLLPSNTVAMVLEARIHLLENIFSTNHIAIDLTLIKGPSGGNANDRKKNPGNLAASGTTTLHKAIYISLAFISSAVVIFWTCSCFLCPRIVSRQVKENVPFFEKLSTRFFYLIQRPLQKGFAGNRSSVANGAYRRQSRHEFVAGRFDVCKCWSNSEEKQNSSSPLVGNSSTSDCSELMRIETECRSLNEKR
ncbi:hypothetical protein M513_03339, partial [Trichuris suis]